MTYSPRFNLVQMQKYCRASSMAWSFIFGWRAFTGKAVGEKWTPADVLTQIPRDCSLQWGKSSPDDIIDFVETILHRKVYGGDSISHSEVMLAVAIEEQFNQLLFAVSENRSTDAVEERRLLVELLDSFSY